MTGNFVYAKWIFGLVAAGLLAGCAVRPVRLEDGERERLAAESREKLFSGQEPLAPNVTLYQAIARAIKYQADYRSRIMEQASALGQLDVAQFDMLPKLTLNAGYTSRDNDSFGFGYSPSGTVATNPSASSERVSSTANVGFAWNVLDFGLGYYRAKQLADQSLILAERRRKALQNLVQDVRLAWWRTEAAQRLLPQIDGLLEEVEQAIERSRVIENRRLLPPMQTASLRRALLDLEQQISLRRQDLAQAPIELAGLLNVSPGTEVIVATPPEREQKVLELSASIDALEAAALRNRPEIAEEAYKARVSDSEARKSVLGLFPSLNLTVNPRNYDSNRYLVNHTWTSAGLGVAFNLVKAFSGPSIGRSAEAQRQFDETRRLAVAMGILTQTRIAAVRYGLLAHEFSVWNEAARDDDQIVKYLAASAEVGTETEFELIRAKARYFVSRINRDLVYASLEAALGRIYNSVGIDSLPDEMASHETVDLAQQLQQNIQGWRDANFSPKAPFPDLPVSIGRIEGVPAELTKDFRAAMDRVLELAKIGVANEAQARLQINTAVEMGPLQGGGRSAKVKLALRDVASNAIQFESEFKTTLSEPIDLEQWRTLGEAAAYRAAGPLRRLQSGRTLVQRVPAEQKKGSELRLAPELGGKVADAEATQVNPGTGELLLLRLDQALTQPVLEHLSRAESHGYAQTH